MRFCRKCGRSLIGEPERCDRCGVPTSIKFKKPPAVYLEVKANSKLVIHPSNLSTEEDVITNPQDYPHQSFPYAQYCQYGHHWPPGTSIPLAKGNHCCPECGERLRISRKFAKKALKELKRRKSLAID